MSHLVNLRNLVALVVLAFLSGCGNGHDAELKKILLEEKELMHSEMLIPDSARAAALLTDYMDFAKQYPKDSMAVEFLFRAGDLAQGVGNNSLSQECYSSIISSYAGSPKAPAAMFMLAFVTDQRLGDKERAKRLYLEFLEKYPDHTLAVSAKATIDQLNSGLTDEELVRMFEQRTDSSEKDSVSR